MNELFDNGELFSRSGSELVRERPGLLWLLDVAFDGARASAFTKYHDEYV